MADIMKTERLLLFPSSPRLAPAVAAYFVRNREFLRPFEPIREKSFFTVQGQRRLLRQEERDMAVGSGYRFWMIPKAPPAAVIGSVALVNVVRGSFQGAAVSYRADKDHVNSGYVTEALARLVAFAFRTLGLHRLEANIMPRNKPSLRVVEKLGFSREGLARAYLNINGVWEDHVQMAIINAAFPGRVGSTTKPWCPTGTNRSSAPASTP
ncbi:MAG: GNAT family N-acetyltransferase [Oscillospiraceae bacterium]|nr:GNAT family N-acetyltransferase [Oscillospiraceae bacterium]